MNNEKVYLKGYVVGHSADTLGYKGLQIQLENMDIVEVDKNLVYKNVDESQKVEVPQFVADWYEKHKENFEYDLWEYLTDWEEQEPSYFKNWINNENNTFQTLVNMHQFGYKVEKEKRYYVRFKGMESGDFNYLNFIKFQHAWVLSSIKLDKKFRTEHTKKQLEEAGFGWVFDCPGIEIEEVKDES